MDGFYIAGAQRHCLELLKVLTQAAISCTVVSVDGGGRWADLFRKHAARVVMIDSARVSIHDIANVLHLDRTSFVTAHLSRAIQWIATQDVPPSVRLFAHLHSEPSEHERWPVSGWQRFERVFFPSQRTLDVASVRGSVELAAARPRCHVLPNGFATQSDRSMPTSVLQKGAPLHVAVVSRIDEDKLSIPLLINTIHVLRLQATAVHVRVAGGGSCLNELRERVCSQALGDLVEFLGFVDDPAPVYVWADVVFLPSKRESMPYVLLESLEFQRPLVVPAVGIFRDEAIGELVFTFPPEDHEAAARAILSAAGTAVRSVPRKGPPWGNEVLRAYRL